MTKIMDERAGRISHAELEVPTVTAEVLDGVVTALDLAYVFDRLHELCQQNGGPVRRVRARLFGPGPGTRSFAEATLVLGDGSTVSESGDGTTTRLAVDLLASRLEQQLRVREQLRNEPGSPTRPQPLGGRRRGSEGRCRA